MEQTAIYHIFLRHILMLHSSVLIYLYRSFSETFIVSAILSILPNHHNLLEFTMVGRLTSMCCEDLCGSKVCNLLSVPKDYKLAVLFLWPLPL
jgi:hypothetical protein